MQYHGQMAIQTAVLVGFTQLIPEHQVQVMGVLKARVKVRPKQYGRVSWLNVFTDATYGVPYPVYSHVSPGVPIPLDCDSVCLALLLSLAPALQEE
jgi:hypothetical protein